MILRRDRHSSGATALRRRSLVERRLAGGPAGCRSDRAPQAQASASASAASTASGTSAGGGTRTTAPPRASTASAPSAPSLTATAVPSAANRAAAASTSSMPAIRRASAALGSRTSTSPSISRRPPSHPPDGSQLGSTDVVAPLARATARRSGSPGASARAPARRGRKARRFISYLRFRVGVSPGSPSGSGAGGCRDRDPWPRPVPPRRAEARRARPWGRSGAPRRWRRWRGCHG